MIRKLLYHILFWLFIMLSFAVSEWAYRQTFADAIIFELLYLPSRLVAVYVNWFLLIPRFLYKNRLIAYFSILVLLLIVLAQAHRFFVLYWGYPRFFPEWVTNWPVEPFNISRLAQAVLIILLPVAITTGFKFFINWYRQRQETEMLKQEKTDAELKFLKSQTNPHFLFNTLNSIYGLALEKSDKTPEAILKLSDVLSYTLYESNTDLLPLQKELRLIENIISLQKERYGKRVSVNLRVVGAVEGCRIPPLILVPFVENAFKHGLKDEVERCEIDIELELSGQQLSFLVRNTKPIEGDLIYEKSGLGLQNVSRRLDLIYGADHELLISSEASEFQVALRIKLKDV